MSDDKSSDESDEPNKREPIEDLKQGLGLLFRAAKGAVQQLPTDKVEVVAKDAVKEVGRAFESLGHELDRAFKTVAENVANVKTGSTPPAEAPPAAGAPPAASASSAAPPDAPPADAKDGKPADKPAERWDDAYAPEPPKGPRVG